MKWNQVNKALFPVPSLVNEPPSKWSGITVSWPHYHSLILSLCWYYSFQCLARDWNLHLNQRLTSRHDTTINQESKPQMENNNLGTNNQDLKSKIMNVGTDNQNPKQKTINNAGKEAELFFLETGKRSRVHRRGWSRKLRWSKKVEVDAPQG